MRGWRMPQQVEAKVHIHWVPHYLPTLELTGICPEPKAGPLKGVAGDDSAPATATPPPRASRLTWPARCSRDPSRRRHLGATAEEGASRGKEREKSQERGGRGRGEGTAGSRPAKGGSQKQQPAAWPQVPSPGPPLRLSAAGHVRPRRWRLLPPRRWRPRRCHVPERQGPVCTVVPLPGLWRPPGPPCRWGWRLAAPQAPLRRLLLPETWNRFAQPGWSLNFFNPHLFDHCVM